MDQLPPIEYWIYFQLGIDIGLILLILFFLRQLKKTLITQPQHESPTIPPRPSKDTQLDTTSLDVLKSLMESAKESSEEFDRLIQEKKMLIAMLDEKLELKRREFIRIIKKGDSVAEDLKRVIAESELRASSSQPSARQTSLNPPEPESETIDPITSAEPKPEPRTEPDEPKPDQTEAVTELASRGLESHAIAARLSIPVGEVELILGLHRITSSSGRSA